ncbi:MAG TPA: kinase [Caulobacteraceae bacterium]|jgi:D-glycerate 3-kinase|nr:kinase [Caulobacteraceae bacterium]
MAASPTLQDFISRERLPAEFAGLVQTLHAPIAQSILRRLAAAGRPLVVGLCGPQGSGKTTAGRTLELLLNEAGARTVVLGLDDLYLGRSERERLAGAVHPLLATRGPPGTHDPALGARLITDLAGDRATALPLFDKAKDDRAPEDEWRVIQGPVQVVIFEGWCVAARPQPAADLVQPVNALETERDPDGVWRRYVNDALAGPYQGLFGCIDYLIMFRPPSFEVILDWRIQQERKLREASGGNAVMSDEEVSRFIQHYERIARWLDCEMPDRADMVIDLDASRQVVDLRARPVR